jgi:hypothetical protein
MGPGILQPHEAYNETGRNEIRNTGHLILIKELIKYQEDKTIINVDTKIQNIYGKICRNKKGKTNPQS